MRLDVFLTEKGLCESRQRAKLLIESGLVMQNGRIATKPAAAVAETDRIEIVGEALPYVSRGALKLEKAYEAFGLDVRGQTAIDVGASTGGFTEYLLLRGAARVYAVDSGSGQLAAKLRRDARVVSMEKYNARLLSPKDFPVPPTFAVMDVSFALQTVALKALPVLILGGFTSVPGAIVGGLVIGVGEKLGEFYWGPLVGGGIESWLAYVIALAVLLVRPQGLFGEKIIERI